MPTPGDELSADDIEASEAPHDFERSEVGPQRTVDEDGNVTETNGRSVIVTDKKGKFIRASQTGGPPEQADEQAPEHDSDLREPLPPVPAAELKKVRITKVDLEKYGYTPGCPRCARLEYGQSQTRVPHNDECRLRMYRRYQREGDVKWRRAREDIQQGFAQCSGDAWIREGRRNEQQDTEEPPAKAARTSPRSRTSPRPSSSSPPSPVGKPRMYSPSDADPPRADQDEDDAPGLVEESDDEDSVNLTRNAGATTLISMRMGSLTVLLLPTMKMRLRSFRL